MPVRADQEQQVVPAEREVVLGRRLAVGALRDDARAAVPPTRSGRVRAGRPTRNSRAMGAAVRPYRVTVATITTKVAGRILDAPPIPLATRPAVNVEAVAAATIPRGAIQPMNARSPFLRSVPGGRERHDGPGHEKKDSGQTERGQDQMPEGLGGHGGRDG